MLCHGALFDGRCEAPVASPSVCSLSWATAGGVLKSSVFIACLALNRSGSLIGCALRTAVEVECFLSGPRATEACKSSESLNPKKTFLTSGKVKHLKISGVGFHSGGGVLSLSIEALSLSIEAHTIICDLDHVGRLKMQSECISIQVYVNLCTTFETKNISI